MHRKIKKKHAGILFLVAIILSSLVFFSWLLTVAAPVAAVELTYQYKKTLSTTFGVTDIRALVVPNFNISVEQQSRHNQGGIEIDSLFLDEPVVYNVDPNDAVAYTEALKHGIAHAAGTNLPGYGGLGYYFAHSSNPAVYRQFNAVFYLLGKLKGGETVTLWYQGKQYDYVVTHTKITDPSDTSFLIPESTKESIVMQTCWPPGTSAKRLLVFASRKE